MGVPEPISIHAPLAGFDFVKSTRRRVGIYFNPRTPYGVRHAMQMQAADCCCISIHAPLAGCDRKVFTCSSIMAVFQSTHPLRGARFSPAEFQHITGAGHTQCPGKNAHIPGDEEVSPALGKSTVVGVFVKDRSVGGAEIFRPLVLDIDKRPLAAAELEVLQTGELEEILLGINHPIRVQVTPSGSFSSSTVTA